jgi:hypothetical protein
MLPGTGHDDSGSRAEHRIHERPGLSTCGTGQQSPGTQASALVCRDRNSTRYPPVRLAADGQIHASATGAAASDPAVTYRAELSGRALKQVYGLPGPAFDSLIEAMAEVIDYPDDPLRTFPTSDPYVRRVELGDAGLITYLIDDGASAVIILDITWAG